MTLPFGRYIDEPNPVRAQEAGVRARTRDRRSHASCSIVSSRKQFFPAARFFRRSILPTLSFAWKRVERGELMERGNAARIDSIALAQFGFRRAWTGHAGNRECRREVFLVRASCMSRAMSKECR